MLLGINHIRFHNFEPLLLHLAAIRNTGPKIIEVLPNSWAPKYFPPYASIRAPAIGGPVNDATPTIEDIIPILTPALLRSVVKLDSAEGKRL